MDSFRASQAGPNPIDDLMLNQPLLELCSDGIFAFLPEAKITYWSPAAERQYGWSAAEALGRDAGALLRSSFERPRSEVVAEVTRLGRWAGRIFQRRKDGSQVVVDARWVQLRDVAGNPVAVVAVNRDVTEQHEAMQRESAKAALLDLAPEAIFTISLPDQKITYWNRGASQLYGWSPEQAIGRDPSDLIPAERGHRAGDIVAKVVERGSWSGSIVHQRHDGSAAVVDCRWVLMSNNRGRPQTVLAVNRDVTLERMAEVAKADFVNLVAHELRTPVTVMQGYLSLVFGQAYGPVAAEWERPLTAIATQLHQLDRLVDSVVTLVRVGERTMTSRTPVELASVVNAAIKRARRNSSTPLKINFNPSAALVTVSGAKRQIAKIVDALLENAVGHSDPEQPIDVWLTESPPSIYIRDRGAGIASEDAQLVFNQFGRRNLPEYSARSGLGLGLSTSRRLARAMGGDVSLESSARGEGSIFRLTLPAARQAGREERRQSGNALMNPESGDPLVARSSSKARTSRQHSGRTLATGSAFTPT